MNKKLRKKMLALRFNEETATSFVRETTEGILPHDYAESITGLVDTLFD